MQLHEPPPVALSSLVPLDNWFRSLELAVVNGGVFVDCAGAAADLLSDRKDAVALHGDIHHGNILDFRDRGWRAIDPKGLRGGRGFDFANLFCNPDEGAADPVRFDRRLAIVSETARIDRTRLLRWILAWAGLSAAFSLEDGESPDGALAIAELAKARLA